MKYEVEVTERGRFWSVDGKRHREDGPAIEWANGTKYWFFNGQLHREDGPAVEYADGAKDWFLNGVKLTEEEFEQRIQDIIVVNGIRYKRIR